MLVYQTFNVGEAHMPIHITHNPNAADLCVFITKNRGLAQNESCWFICGTKATADKTFNFGSRGIARLSVCFVPSLGQAGWQRAHPLQGKLAR